MSILAFACAGCLVVQFTTGVDLVEVYATVTTRKARPVTDLTRDDFIVREDGAERRVALFAAGDFPLSVALAIDRSWSMAGERLAVARSAAHAFLGELGPDDEAMLIAISNEIETLAPLSRDRTAQHQAVNGLQSWGTTALHDAILAALDRIDSATGRRALVVLSDGNDRYSDASAADVIARARRGDALVYPVAFGRDIVPLFEQLADVSGGRAFAVRHPSQLASVLRDIAGELRRQYLIGYEPRPPEPDARGQWRRIEVEVRRPPGARVRARAGYYAQ